MADTLTIHDLAVECRIGVFDWERAKPQTIWLDLELPIDAAKAAARDEMQDAVDYSRLVAEVREVAQSSTFNLLETLAEASAARILEVFGVARVRVRVKKRALPGIDYAAVEVERVKVGRSRTTSRSPRAARTSRAGPSAWRG